MDEDIDKLLTSLDKYYYHSFPLNKHDFMDIMNNGIKCFYLLNSISGHCGAWNGRYYISLLKRNSNNEVLNMIEENPLLIINPKIIALKAKRTNPQCFTNTILPIRYSPYDKEYQALWHISSKNIVGISYKIDPKSDHYQFRLNDIRNIMEWLDELNIDLPLINSYTNELIDKDKIIYLTK